MNLAEVLRCVIVVVVTEMRPGLSDQQHILQYNMKTLSLMRQALQVE